MKMIKTYNSRGLVPEQPLIRSKPCIASNDFLDELNDQFGEWEKAQHDIRECLDGCQHCEADAEAKHYDRVMFDLLHKLFSFKEGFKP